MDKGSSFYSAYWTRYSCNENSSYVNHYTGCFLDCVVYVEFIMLSWVSGQWLYTVIKIPYLQLVLWYTYCTHFLRIFMVLFIYITIIHEFLSSFIYRPHGCRLKRVCDQFVMCHVEYHCDGYCYWKCPMHACVNFYWKFRVIATLFTIFMIGVWNTLHVSYLNVQIYIIIGNCMDEDVNSCQH